jgi:hypothetical protein
VYSGWARTVCLLCRLSSGHYEVMEASDKGNADETESIGSDESEFRYLN